MWRILYLDTSWLHGLLVETMAQGYSPRGGIFPVEYKYPVWARV